MKIYIIAEAGVNHNGDINKAFALIEKASESRADAVKFQTFKTDQLVTKKAKKADYQRKNKKEDETQYEMLKKLELSFEDHSRLANYSKQKNIDFLSTAFDFESLNFLAYRLKLKKLKISSGDLTNAPLLLEYAKTKRNLILSTGMSNLKEIEEALKVISYGLLGGSKPSMESINKSYSSLEGREKLKKKVTLLHCTSEYPAPISEINLKSILTLQDTFGLEVGYSDHTKGINASLCAASLGATVIEKHFTLDKNDEGPDHGASLEPEELSSLVKNIREIEIYLGDGKKVPTKSELKNLLISRKSLVALTNIDKEDNFSKNNLGVKRPGTGRSPMEYWSMIGKKSDKKYSKDDLID